MARLLNVLCFVAFLCVDAEKGEDLQRGNWMNAVVDGKSAKKFIPGVWRKRVGEALADERFQTIKRGDLYEFGVYTGESLKSLRRHFAEYHVPHPHTVWGFDSFAGLDEEAEGVKNDRKGTWVKGAYSAADAMGIYNFQQLADSIKTRVLENPDGSKTPESEWPLKFIKGYFKDSLTSTLAKDKKMRVATYVDIDVDMYLPTKQALTWMLENKLIVPGTMIGYDDFGSTELWVAGESRAQREMQSEFGVELELVSSECSVESTISSTGIMVPEGGCPGVVNFHPIFRVVSVKGHGEVTEDVKVTEDVNTCLFLSPVCFVIGYALAWWRGKRALGSAR